MAKIYGLFGSMTGKLADVVMAVRNGEQVARKYQPVVLNPSTPAQIAQRAKLKLMSQLSAVMAPAIAFPRLGSISSRNRFTKVNIGKSSYTDNQASIPLGSIDLTGGVVALPHLTDSLVGNVVTVGLPASDTPYEFDSVVYVYVQQAADSKLRLGGITEVTTPGANNTFSAQFTLSSSAGAVLAYGVRLNSEAARTKYGDLFGGTGTGAYIGKLITSGQLNASDVTLTETVGIDVTASREGGDDEKKESRKK